MLPEVNKNYCFGISLSNMDGIASVLLFCLWVVCVPALASDNVVKHPSPDRSAVIEHVCSERGCLAWGIANGQKTTIVDNAQTQDIAVEWLANLADVQFSCGSPCSVHYYYEPEHGVSRPLGDVLAVDNIRLCALRPTADGLEVVSIYGKRHRFWHIRNDDPRFGFNTGSAVMGSTIEAWVLPSGQFHLGYTDRHGHQVDKAFQPGCH